MKLQIGVCGGRRNNGNWAMVRHMERISLSPIFISAVLFTSLVDGRYGPASPVPSIGPLPVEDAAPSPLPSSRPVGAAFSSPPEYLPPGLSQLPPSFSFPPSSDSFLSFRPAVSHLSQRSLVVHYLPDYTVHPPTSPSPSPLSSYRHGTLHDKKNTLTIMVGIAISGIAVFVLIGMGILWKYKRNAAGDCEQPGEKADASIRVIGTTAVYTEEIEEKPAKTENVNHSAKTASAAKESGSVAIKVSSMATPNRMSLVAASARCFAYNEILSITGNFEQVIGEGGTSIVYRGQLPESGRMVAVKKMKESISRFGDLLAEVKILMRIHHKNLVSLVGFCEEGDNIILVSEYMANGSLFDILKARSSKLTWRKRLQIALDAATGLEYLHTGCKPTVIHRDIKSTNILLDENLEAKLADFGLSKAGAIDGSECSAYQTKVAGTTGYIDPEYINTQTLTKKSDVYSFGVVLFELITGKPAIVTTETNKRCHLINWLMPMLIRGEIESLLDPLLKGCCNIESVWEVAGTAKTATKNPSERPDMSDIVETLKEALKMETSWSDTTWSSEISTSRSFREIPDNPTVR